MKVYYDNIIYNLQQSGGISRYWHELSMRLLCDTDFEPVFIERKEPAAARLRHSLNISPDNIIYEKNLPLKLARYLPVAVPVKSAGIFHSSYYRVSSSAKLKKVVTVHDFTYEYFFSGLKRFVHSTQKEFAVKTADAVICVSENTKRDLLKFYKYISPDRVFVVHNGVSGSFSTCDEQRDKILSDLKLADDRYAVFIGERGGYKNFGTAVKAASLCGVFLLVLGGRDISADEKNLLEKELKGRYLHFGFVENETLKKLYGIAECLFYPSLYEGFGIPVLEAMRCGCPVIASNTSSLPEAAGDAGILVKDITPEGFAEAFSKLGSTTFRNELIKKGFAHSAKFSWDRCWQETRRVYLNIS